MNIFHNAQEWFDSSGKDNWGVCPLTEVGFVRITTNPSFIRVHARTLKRAAILAQLARSSRLPLLAITDSWAALTAPFASRISGHQQVTDAYLLGLAIKEDGVLVTFDRGLKYLAGPSSSRICWFCE